MYDPDVPGTVIAFLTLWRCFKTCERDAHVVYRRRRMTCRAVVRISTPVVRTLYRDSEIPHQCKVTLFNPTNPLLPGAIFFLVLFGARSTFSLSEQVLIFRRTFTGKYSCIGVCSGTYSRNILLSGLTSALTAGIP